jgi:hypothetical protein
MKNYQHQMLEADVSHGSDGRYYVRILIRFKNAEAYMRGTGGNVWLWVKGESGGAVKTRVRTFLQRWMSRMGITDYCEHSGHPQWGRN